MGVASLGTALGLALACATTHGAREVSVDWSAVPDEVIARCELDGFEAAMLQGMVDEGYAVVRRAPPDGVRLELTWIEGRFIVRGYRLDRTLARDVAIPNTCDATMQVELLDRMVQVAAELSRSPPPPVRTATVTAPVPVPVPPPAPPHPRWRISAGAGAVLPSGTAMLAIRAGVRHRIETAWQVGLLVEGSVRSAESVLVFEPVLAAQAVYELVSTAGGLGVLAGLEAGLLGHIYSREDTGTGGHADGRFGLVLEGRLPVLGATLLVLPYIRIRPVRQQVGTKTAFAARHFGAVVALSLSFDL